jgi:hypothetical protein
LGAEREEGARTSREIGSKEEEIMSATRYNASRAGSLWFVDELPARLAGSGDPGSEAFADEVRSIQAELGLTTDGKLGPRTWSLLPRPDTVDESLDRPVVTDRDVRVDTDAEAFERIARGFRFAPHVAELAEDFVDVLNGNVGAERALRLYRAMRHDGRSQIAEMLRKGGKDAETAYAYKARDAEQMRKAYSKRWHKWIDADRRLGMGTHWTGGTGSAYKAARYLCTLRPGRVSSNVFIDYDGSVFIAFATYPDAELGDSNVFTAHGAHNPATFGVDFTSPGFVERKAGRWQSKSGSKLSDELVAACGIVTLDDLALRSWPATATSSIPWINRKKPGRVWSVRDFLAPTWEQLASYLVLGRIHAELYQWTAEDFVVVGHHQRSDSRADPFFYPLAWLRESILSGEDVLDPDHWLPKVNAEEVGELLTNYRRDVAGSGW